MRSATSPSGGRASSSRGTTYGLAAAALFGASTPVAKLLVPGAGPLALAGLLYLGAGVALLALSPFRRPGAEAPIQRSDLPVLAGMILAGGIVGPTLLLIGLARVSGAAASLLLNLEAPFTIVLSVWFLGERLSRREIAGVAAVVLGASALAWSPGERIAGGFGLACVAGACAAWAIDNTLSQRMSLRDPVAVTRVKTLVAGTFNLVLGLLVADAWPRATGIGGALLTGALGYGVSIVLHLLAVRSLGAARQAANFATAPFIGAVIAMPLLGERLSPALLGAGAAMATGVALMLRARHAHAHVHEAEEHEHAHVHDEHHAHAHDANVVEPHSHVHRHARLAHEHPHAPDIHHRHGH